MAILTLNGATGDDPKILEWRADHTDELGLIAASWFAVIKQQGDDVTELLHDGYPTACVGIYPFAYVGVFKAHLNVGFFHGAELPDPAALLQGTGKRMRHVKIRASARLNPAALENLIESAYLDVKQRIGRINPAT